MPRDALLLREVIDAAERILVLIADAGPGPLGEDRDRFDALLWNYTVLGEAVSQLSSETKGDHPEVPWADPVRLRNRIVHGYWSIDPDVLVATAREDIPALLEALRALEEEA